MLFRSSWCQKRVFWPALIRESLSSVLDKLLSRWCWPLPTILEFNYSDCNLFVFFTLLRTVKIQRRLQNGIEWRVGEETALSQGSPTINLLLTG